MDGTVLIADDDRTIRTVLTQAFTRAGCKVHSTSSLGTLMRWVHEGKGDLVITDVMMPDGNGIEKIPEILQLHPDLPVIVISAQNTIVTTVKATEARAFDYLPKPFDLPELMSRAAKGLQHKRRVLPAKKMEDVKGKDAPLIGKTEVMQALYRTIARIMNTDLSILIDGESGSGKSLIAQTIHGLSDRSDQPFISIGAEQIQDAAVLETVFENTLQGTIVFENLADMNLDVQARLVQFLSQHETNKLPHLISTSQIPISALIKQGKFREDLYYRLAGVEITAEPLRDRIDDIPDIAESFLQHLNQTMSESKTLTEAAMSVLKSATLPGNVRQLKNIVQRAFISSTESEIAEQHISAALNISGRNPSANTKDEGGAKLSDSVGRHLKRYFDLHEGELPPSGVYQRILREVEVPLIEIALNATQGNQAKCAELLGINRNTLRKKITELKIVVTRGRKLM